MNQQIQYSRLSDLTEHDLFRVAKCYADVFSAPPWNEFMRCSCGARLGRDDVRIINGEGDSGISQFTAPGHDRFGHELEPYWNIQEVVQDLKAKIIGGSSIWVAHKKQLIGKKVIGFCVGGYFDNVYALRKVLDMESLVVDLQRALPESQNIYCYQGDIGVLLEYRSKGVAKELFARRLYDFKTRNPSGTAIVRTMTKPASVTYKWYMSLGYKVVSEYGDERGRVILAKPISEL